MLPVQHLPPPALTQTQHRCHSPCSLCSLCSLRAPQAQLVAGCQQITVPHFVGSSQRAWAGRGEGSPLFPIILSAPHSSAGHQLCCSTVTSACTAGDSDLLGSSERSHPTVPSLSRQPWTLRALQFVSTAHATVSIVTHPPRRA